jgi:uncharacterized protein
MKTKFSAPVFEIKQLEETGLFSGYGAVFGNKDSYGDVIEPGAFSVSLTAHATRKSRPKMFWQHNMHEPIGSWAEMKEDSVGLWVSGKLNMDVQRGREAYSLLKAGDIDGLSIGYQTVKAEPDKKRGVLLLKELDLIEVSVVSVGANDRALIDAVKQIRGEALPTLPEFEGFLREAGFSKTEATAIAGNGLSHLLRSESDSEPTGEEFMASILGAMNANH